MSELKNDNKTDINIEEAHKEKLFSEYSNNSNETQTPTLIEKEHYEEHKNNMESVRNILTTWIKNQIKETKLRSIYAVIIFILLVIQVIVLNVMLFFIGFKVNGFTIDYKFMYAFLSSVVAEILGFILLIVKYLFNPLNEQTIELIKEFLNHKSDLNS